MTQLNTPYPATAYLTGFLRSRGEDARQADPALELVLRLLSRSGLRQVLTELERKPRHMSRAVDHFIHHAEIIIGRVDAVIGFLQGKDPSLALRIVSGDFLPEGPRFEVFEQM